MFTTKVFPNLPNTVTPNFDNQDEMNPSNVASVYINFITPSKMQTNGTTRLKEGLTQFQRSIMDEQE